MARTASVLMGEVVEQRWTCVAASAVDDGGNEIVAPGEIGRVVVERRAYFAFRAEGEEWIATQEREGFCRRSLSPAATFYYGLTDAPSNCWAAIVERDDSSTLRVPKPHTGGYTGPVGCHPDCLGDFAHDGDCTIPVSAA